MADRIADERQSLEHDERAHHRAHDPDEERGDEPTLHEAVGHRVDQEADQVHQRLRRGSGARRRASSW